MVGLEAFATGGALDLPLCENINETVRLFNVEDPEHTKKVPTR
jgi:hypothetical protein